MVRGSGVGVVVCVLLGQVLGEVARDLQEGKMCWKSCQENNVFQVLFPDHDVMNIIVKVENRLWNFGILIKCPQKV